MALDFEVAFEPDHQETRQLAAGLSEHAQSFVDKDGFDSVAVFIRDDGRIFGGVSGLLNWNWLQVSLLWVDNSLRGGGYGRQLMETIESLAREHGCQRAHVDTFSFQAREFYESLGYDVFATLDDYPPGHSRYYLKKAL